MIFRVQVIRNNGFMLIEVLIALALFGLSAVYLVDGAFVAARTIRVMKDTREMEQDLLWVRGEIFKDPDYEKIKDGGDIQSLSMGEVRWETEVEMSDVLDVYQVTLTLEYEGNEELGFEGGERVSQMYLFRPTWGQNGDFSSERTRLLEDKKDKIREIQEQRRRQ
ncbi:MAG: prepilin-type N-terminal cleavage/methylation domain-containing protein [Opitutae bacterium]|jgi:prepilin-type N-terminal cleavage/methylation domain-containing protein|nr:prepilin-type N-terminal cleavage/methylation domain-containing protein [Opitutae bacterium]